MPLENRRTIIGLVDAGGPGGVSDGRSKGWCLTLQLAGWRHPGSAVVIGDLRCELPVSEGDLDSLMDMIEAYSIIEAEIDGELRDGVARLHRLVRTDAEDSELELLAGELQRPIVLSDPVLGRLEYDRKFDWFSGRAEWCGLGVEVSLSCAQPEESTAVLEAATRLFADQREWHRRVREYAVEQLLPLKNESWLGEDETGISADEFLSKMVLESITVEESGDFAFWHNDGDLFWGHAIQISGNLSTGLKDADIPG